MLALSADDNRAAHWADAGSMAVKFQRGERAREVARAAMAPKESWDRRNERTEGHLEWRDQ